MQNEEAAFLSTCARTCPFETRIVMSSPPTRQPSPKNVYVAWIKGNKMPEPSNNMINNMQ